MVGTRVNDDNRKKVVEAVAIVQIPDNASILVGDKGFVRFTIQSTGAGVVAGSTLFVFDHRPEVFRAATVPTTESSQEEAGRALVEAVKQPANVVVMQKTVGEKTFYYVTLFPTNGHEPTALLSTSIFTRKRNAGFSIEQDSGLWKWTSESSSRTGDHGEMVLVALTDKDHLVIVKSWGFANIGHSNQDLTVIGAQIRQMSEEEFLLGEAGKEPVAALA